MADKKFDLVFNASLEVGQVKSAVASLTKSLENAGAKIPQSMASNLNRMIQSLNTELNKLEGMTDIQLDPKNAKNVGKSYERIFQTFQQIKAALGDIHRTAGIDPEKFFPSEIASNIAKAAQAVQKYKKAMEAGIKTDEYTKATKDISDAQKKVKSLNDKLDEAARKRQSSSIVKDQLQETRKKLQAEKDQAEVEDKAAKEAQKAIQDRIKSQEKLAQVEEEIAKRKKKQQEAVNKAAKANEIKNERESMKQAKGKGTDTKIYRDAVASYAESTAEVRKLQGEIDQLEAEYAQLSQAATVTADEIAAANDRATKATTELANVQKRLNKNQSDIDAADTKYAAATAEVKTLAPEVQKAEDALNQLIQKKEQLESSFEQSIFDELIQELEKLGIKLPDTERSMEGVERALESLADEARGKVATALEGVKDAAEGIDKPLGEMGKKADDVGELGEQAKRAEQDMENLKNQVLDFFSITNTIQIFKNAIRDAFDTVKELDAAMTETAVVTDFSIGDMWDKLPEYSDEANKLGTSIASLYEATTLYYQQGLKSQEAMDVGVETMKMARIAGMDAAAATEAMTAALRGFNMEINEISATRINDVYSELAAITAADTSQIATAMSKTASIAASANMEFETTAALLAQIIETTQEAPETAGTAMKTIIARFTEVKELFDEGMLTGKDSEGEEININKIDAALKKVGISLKEFLKGEKGVDDIFLELASKWDSLDLATQRYIATTAAGSRQQSRFLAMMSNYERTMELVNAATTSAGASQKQFDKTLESLDAKLQRLKNAWAEFTMGLANSDAIKFIIDLLTALIEGINKLTGAFGNEGLGGFITMLVRLTTVIASLKSGEAILNSILKSLAATGISSVFGLDLNDKKINFFAPLTNDLKLFIKEWKGGKGLLENFKIGLKSVGAEGTGLLSILIKYGKYIGIFTLLAGAILLVAKAFQKAQDSAKLEAINKSIEEMSTEAEKAKEELNEITSARQKLNDMNGAFENLTRGTSEWTSALVDTNSQVLDLLEKYSILRANIGEYGQLVIDGNSWNDLLAQQQKVIYNMNAAKLVLQSEREQLQASIDLDNFIINSKTTEVQKKMTEWDLKLSKFYDSEIFGINGTRWGDLFFNNPIERVRNSEKDFRESVVTGNTGGLTESQIISLAEIFAYNGAVINKNYEAQYDKLIKQLGEDIDVASIKTFLTSTPEVTNAFNELIESSYGVAEAQKNLSLAFVGNAIANSEIAKEDEAESIGNIIAKSYNSSLDTQVDSKVEEIKEEYSNNNGLDAAKIAKEYAAIMGYEAVNGKVYTDRTYSTQVQADTEAMLRAIATEKITVEVQAQAKKAWDTVRTKETDQRELFKSLFSQNGRQITASQIGTYQLEDGQIDINKILEDMGLKATEAEAAFGMKIDEITKMLTNNFKNASDRILKQRQNLSRRMTKYSLDDKKDYKTSANDLAGLEQKFGEQIRDTLEEVFSSLESTADFNIISQGFEYFKNFALAGTQEDVDQLTNFIEQVDWSNPIDSVYKLNREIEKGTIITKGFAQTITEVDSAFLSSGSQFQTFFTSDAYKNMEENLTQIYETQGKITDADVRKLASEYSYLNKLLKNTSTTAEGLADILTAIEEGTMGFEELTDAVIAAIGGMNDLGDSTSEVLQKLQNLDLGDDLGEVQDTYTEWAEKIKEFQEGGEFGNPQYKGILEYIFGRGFEGGRTGDDLIAWYQQLGDQVEKIYGQDMYYGWEQAAKGLNIYGQAIENQKAALEELGIQLELINGQVVFNVPDDMTFDQTAAHFAEIVGGTKEHWEDMLTYLANRTPEMWRTWELADYNQIGKRIAEAETTNVAGKKIITNEELDAVTTQLAVKYPEKDIENIETDIEKQLNDNKVEILTLLDTDDAEKQAEHLINELDMIFGDKAGAFAETFYGSFNDTSSLDLSGLLAAVKSLNLPEEVTNQMVNSIAIGAYEAGKVITYEVEGETRELALNLVTNGTDFVEALNAQVAEAEATAESAELDTTATVTIDQATWQGSVNTAKTYIGNVLSGLKYPVTAYVSRVDTSGVGLTGSGGGTGSGATNNSSTRYTARMAEGTREHPKSELALTGEKGPELVETKDGAYLTGVEGPQMANINRGDTVYTAEETEEIYKRKGIKIPAYKGGVVGPASNGANTGGKNSGDGKEKAENPYDFLYNLLRDIQEETRRRERIERRYEKLLDDVDVNAQKLIDISKEELEQLKENRALEEKRIDAREKQIDLYQKENQDLTKYARTETNEYGEQVLRIDWDAINAVTDPDQMERIETYVSQLEEWYSDMEEAQDTLEDIEDQMEEIRLRGRDEYIDLENKIKDAIVAERQEEIDKLGEINNSINDTNAELIDSIQKAFDKQRRERDNQRTEEDLAEKQRRLLYLQQDTSGANDLEILELQKELDTEYEDYTDTLIDQKISDLQAQNDEAAKAREQQITLMQAQLDKQVQNGEIWAEVERLMATGISQTEGLVKGSELEALLKQADGFKGLSETQKMVWMQETNSQIALASTYLNNLQNQIKDLNEEMNRQSAAYEQAVKTPSVPQSNSGSGSGSGSGSSTGSGGGGGGSVNNGSLTKAQVQELQKYLGLTADGLWGTKSKNTAAAMWGSDYSSADKAWKKYQETKNKDSSSPKPTAKDYNDSNNGGKPSLYSASYQVWDADVGKNLSKATRKFSTETEARTEARKLIREFYTKKKYVGGTLEEMIGKAANTIKITKYKTGGLANFTGPAWLDGTKSRPELVLNQRDTQNFIQLKDILSQIMSHNLPNNVSTENNGEITYDIDINVESMTSDYDVEQMANKVKSMINSDARYRNNNAISLKR